MVKRATFLLSLLGLVSLPLACGSSKEASGNGSSGGTSEQPTTVGKACAENAECTASTEFCGDDQKCAAVPAGGEIGYRDGSASSVTFTQIYKASGSPELIDLAFNPSDTTQIWAVGYADDSTHVGSGVTPDDNGSWKRYLDPARAHFMHAPPAIAMGAAPFWGTCGDGDDSFASRQPRMFMGPAIFTTDLSVYAKPAGSLGLGSHYDMLHSTPFCKGIAHEKDNVYWVYNGHNKSIDRYDFHDDHGPGNDDHSDGEIWRYADGELTPSEGTPSHLIFDPADGMLYIADTGASRIVKLDTTSGTKKSGPTANIREASGTKIGTNEPLVASGYMTGTSVEDIGATGLKKPSGIELKGDLLYVTDAETSTFHVFEKATGKEVRKLKTEVEEGGLAGFAFGPDNKIYFVDRKTNRIFRIDPK